MKMKNKLVKRIKKEKPKISKSNQRQFWIEFIELYKTKPALWQNNGEHIDADTKRAAYKELVEKLRQFNDNADIDMVKSKLNSFRACLRRETRKIRQNKNAGIAYEPSWWCFDHIKFLNEHNAAVRAKVEGGEQIKTSDDEMEFLADDEYTVIEQPPSITPPPAQSQAGASTGKQPKSETTFQNHNSSPKYSDIRISADNESLTPICKPIAVDWNNDELDIVCKGWALQYRDLSKQQKLFAKKAIDDILFEAQMATLHRNSVKINEDHRCMHCGRNNN